MPRTWEGEGLRLVPSPQTQTKKLWKNLKELGMPTKTKASQNCIGLKMGDDNEIVFDTKAVANKFNNFFCNIAAKLVDKLEKRPFDETKITDFYKEKGVSPCDFSLKAVSKDKVYNLLSSLNVTKSVGHDAISALFLKDAADMLLRNLLNT